MKYRNDGYNWFVRLDSGELLMESLGKLAKVENISGAWVQGIGTAAWAEVGFYDLKEKDYEHHKLDKSLEIVSLQGNVSWEKQEPFIHIHGTFSDNTLTTFGGHVIELEVSGTCELQIHKWYDKNISRKFNESLGLKLLDL